MFIVLTMIASTYIILAQLFGVDNRFNGVVVLIIMSTWWWLLPIFDNLWYRFKFPKAFCGKHTWTGKWTSSKYNGIEGRLCVNLPPDFDKSGEFTADALLYSSIKCSTNTGTFRQVSLSGVINNSTTEGSATISPTQHGGEYDVEYHALFAREFKQIAGGYTDPNDVGTFSIRKSPFSI